MKVLQVLPALESGGVERGTVDFARELVTAGHQSWVMSTGGRLETRLTHEGSTHIRFPVARKSLLSLRHVRPLRRQLLTLSPDIVHVRSRLPAWLVWLALKPLPLSQRPALVTTFHGLYSVNAYSAVMGRGDAVIAISECVRDYILSNYPAVPADRIHVIHRGVDSSEFNRHYRPPVEWRERFFADYPQLSGKKLLLMPGRLTRWKGQLEFIELLARLPADSGWHGVVVGEAAPNKQDYRQELEQAARERGVDRLTFLGHRSDMSNVLALSSIVYNLSRQPEPFGRTVIEALAMGVPVIAWDRGGPAESLQHALPDGLVVHGDLDSLGARTLQFLEHCPQVQLDERFTLARQSADTLAVYEQLLGARTDGDRQ